ncbi:MAG: iron donor protein CyaY [Proteobacteria bacterium]|nr:iron donor protein CyaY [Pseudomonadota bacterium]MCH9758855.1 iron donor protein CyaY [Pseudomonadota bacterium]
MTEQEDKHYHDACAELFAAIETLLEDNEIDYDNNGNVLEIITEEDEKVIINKQTPMHEVWLAARTGGKHFKLQAGEWRDTRDNTTLLAQLKLLLAL